jgi:hypothetical protein
MTHLSSEQLMSLFGLLAARDIKENAEHHPINNVRIVALASSRYPPNLVTHHNSKVDFVGPDDSSGCSERSANAVAISRVNMGGQFFECYAVAKRHTPQLEGTVVHRQAVIIDIPGP